MRLTEKQSEYIRRAVRRWNFKGGATRSGKTWLDVHYVIPARIRSRAGQPGLTVLLGISRGTLERNVLTPMRALYGEE
ncbi:MAG: PBSX family phage terminase large subunit, partial [Clostridia bacterium]|nr:PBSX family phage terminase large subunit [Clostridia bacterium]